MAQRSAVSALGTGTSSITVAFTGAQPMAGNKVVIAFWARFTSTPGISSVQDNAGQTYQEASDGSTAGHTIIGNVQGLWLWFVDLPSSATWAGNYTITVTFTGGLITRSAGAAIAYGSLAAGQASAVHHAQDAVGSAGVASGAITPSGSGAYVGCLADAATTDPSTILPTGNLADQVVSQHGGTAAVGGIADLQEGSGTQNATWTIDSSTWLSVIAFWPDAATSSTAALPQLLVSVAPKGVAFPGVLPVFNPQTTYENVIAPLGQQPSAASVSVAPATDSVPPPLPVVQLTLPTLTSRFIDSSANPMLTGKKTIYLVVDISIQWTTSGQATWQPFAAQAAFTAARGSSSQLTGSQVLLGTAQNLGASGTSLAAGLYRLSAGALSELQWPDAFLGMELVFPSAINSGAARLFVVGSPG